MKQAITALFLVGMVILSFTIVFAETVKEKEKEITKLEKKELKDDEKDKLKDTYTHRKNDLGKVKDYQEDGTHAIVNFDSGWRVLTSKSKFDKVKDDK